MTSEPFWCFQTLTILFQELLSCRKDLSETKQKVQTMEQDYSSTLMFLIDNCVLKDPSLQTPLNAQRTVKIFCPMLLLVLMCSSYLTMSLQ